MMKHHRKLSSILLIVFLFSISPVANAQFSGYYIAKAAQKAKRINIGKALYSSCSSCHLINKNGTGPGLQRIRDYRTPEWIYAFVKNPPLFISQNPEAKILQQEYGSMMPLYPSLTKYDLEAILDYLDSLPYDSNAYGYRRNMKKIR